MLTYSVAIRTLGTAGDKFQRELESISRQTVQPQKVIAYIAEGYSRPDFQIDGEVYVPVKKGMMAQRALEYREIESDVILMLDDDIWLAPDTAERMLSEIESNQADAVGLDVFRNHELPLKSKLWAVVSNLVFPHPGNKWAFKIHKNGSFSYLRNPAKDFYWSQTCAGAALMIKKKVFEHLNIEEENWLDDFAGAYNEDSLTSYKIYKNGFRLGVLFNSDSIHLNAGSGDYGKKESTQKIRTRARAIFAIWHRTLYAGEIGVGKFLKYLSFFFKLLWLLAMHLIYAIVKLNPAIAVNYLKGVGDGIRFVKSEDYKRLAPYVSHQTLRDEKDTYYN